MYGNRTALPIQKKNEFDIVLTNPPYSQKTRHGNLYDIPSQNGDAVSMQHCFQSLAPNGRAAILVKEDFLTAGGDTGRVRDVVLNSAKNVSIVSLPRRLFEPYTPTKTSIVYFEKSGQRNTTFFYVVRNVGHTFGSRKKSLPENDLPEVLSVFNKNEELKNMQIDHAVIPNDDIRQSNQSLWIYDYKEVIPTALTNPENLGEHIEASGKQIKPSEYPDERFRLLAK